MVPFERIRHVTDSNSLLTALEVMNRERIHQLPVLDREGRFVGVVTRDGVLRAVAVDLELERSEAPPPD
jgi:CBS domain-containing protein